MYDLSLVKKNVKENFKMKKEGFKKKDIIKDKKKINKDC